LSDSTVSGIHVLVAIGVRGRRLLGRRIIVTFQPKLKVRRSVRLELVKHYGKHAGLGPYYI
jgi:hypothetical protein